MFSGRHTGPFHLTYRWFLTLPFVVLQVGSKMISKRDQEAIIPLPSATNALQAASVHSYHQRVDSVAGKSSLLGGSWVALGEPYDRLVLFRMSVAVKTDTSSFPFWLMASCMY